MSEEEPVPSSPDQHTEKETPPYLLVTGKPHISYSELHSWADCSYRHKLQYIDKINMFRPSYHLAFGTACHAALEDYLKTRVMNANLAHEQLDKLWRPEFARAEPKEKDFSLDKLKQQATEILGEIPEFLEKTFPGWELVGAEQALYEAIDAKGAKFKGYIDCIIKSKDKKGKELVWILDWKTSGSGWHPMKKQDPLTGLQLTLYKNFWMQKDGQLSLKDVRCGFVILKRKVKPTKHCELLKVSVGEVTLKRGLRMITSMLMSMERRLHIKNRNSCKFCDFFETEHCK